MSEAERSLIGGILAAPEDRAAELLAIAGDLVVPGDFADPDLAATWEGLLRLDVDDHPLGAAAVRQVLAAHGRALDPRVLGSVLEGAPAGTAASVAYWAREVQESARVRRITRALSDVLTLAEEGSTSSKDLVQCLEGIIVDGPVSCEIPDPAQVSRDALRMLEGELSGTTRGIATGLPDLDRALRFGGWRPGQVVYIGARTSRGKSALLLAFAEAAAARGVPVLFFPLEMAPEDLEARRLVAQAGVNIASARGASEADRQGIIARLRRAADTIRGRSLFFAPPSARSLGAIRAACRRAKRRPGLGLVVVDYAGLVQVGPKTVSLYERATVVSQGLKDLAMSLGVPVLAAVQLNREPAQHGSGKPPRPTLAHFRDSGAIEQDADVCILIHQAGTSDAIVDGEAELIVAKQRNGWTGVVPVVWRAACARFECRAVEEWRP